MFGEKNSVLERRYSKFCGDEVFKRNWSEVRSGELSIDRGRLKVSIFAVTEMAVQV